MSSVRLSLQLDLSAAREVRARRGGAAAEALERTLGAFGGSCRPVAPDDAPPSLLTWFSVVVPDGAAEAAAAALRALPFVRAAVRKPEERPA